MPDEHPAVSSVLTGIWGLVGTIVGIVIATSNYGPSVTGGIFLSLIGITLLGFACYTGYATDHFQVWKYSLRGHRSIVIGHGFTRWAGPIILVLAFLELLLAFWFLKLINEVLASRR